jgi:hypothetical protein
MRVAPANETGSLPPDGETKASVLMRFGPENSRKETCGALFHSVTTGDQGFTRAPIGEDLPFSLDTALNEFCARA